MVGSVGTTDVVSLSVHGAAGALDLHVPSGASSADVAIEYSRQAKLPGVPRLYTRLGRAIAPETTLADAGLVSGAVLVAVPPGSVPTGPLGSGRHAEGVLLRLTPGALSVLWFTLAVASALLAGWLGAHLPETSDLRTATLWLLVGAAAVAALPLGPLAPHRVLAAPAFAGAAAFVLVWDTAPERLPTILGVSALAAAVTAAVARALDRHAEEGLRVWMTVGSAVFLVAALAALAGASTAVVWSLLLVVAMLAPRFVPLLAVDVPDQYLIDLERLAVTAWSARDRPTGRRGRTIVPRQAIATVASSGARMVTAACVAILVVAGASAPLLLRDANQPIDRIGARCVVGFAGAALLLAARSYRHVGARSLLRAAGLTCWLALAVVLFELISPGASRLLAICVILLAALLVVVSVSLGRGWRSAWWSRRAEVAEGICGAFAMGAVVVAVGLFTKLWEIVG